jgi:hypothetical protein
MCAIRLFGVLWFSKFGAWQNLNACLVSQTFQTQDNNFRQIGHPNTQFNVDTHKLVAHKWKNCLVDLERQEYLFHASRVLTGLQKKVCEPLQQQSTLLRWLAEEA